MNNNNTSASILADNLYHLTGVPIYAWDTKDEITLPLFENCPAVPEKLLESIRNLQHTMGNAQFMTTDLFDLPLCICFYQSPQKEVFLLGPVQYQSLSDSEHSILRKLLKRDYGTYTPCVIIFKRFLQAVINFVYSLDRIIVKIPDIIQPEFEDSHSQIMAHLAKYTFEDEPDNIRNHTYADESIYLEVLKDGNIEEMQHLMLHFKMPYSQAIAENKFKNEEYMAVVSISLLSRASIEGGASSTESFRLSDVYLQKISKCKDIKSLTATRNSAFIEFTRLVNVCKGRRVLNNYIEDCKKDIASHIFGKISLRDIARDLGLRESYLASLFQTSEGMSVGEYIRKEKVRLSKNLLTYSDRSIAEIAAYMGFDSQSYFGKIFRKETNLTPNQYRHLNHPPEL